VEEKMTVVLKERPTPRIIEFYGAPITFVPARGTYWITPLELLVALNEDPNSDAVRPLRREINLKCKGHWLGDLPCDPPADLSRLAVADARTFAEDKIAFSELESNRISLLIALLRTMEDQARAMLMHSHTLAPESEALRAKLDQNPHWEGVLTLRNQGLTEGAIAKALSIKVTKVRSALLSLEKWGFEVIKGERLALQQEYDGQAIHVPPVLPSITAKNCLKFKQKGD
jgi:hypothetical protein